MIPARYPSAKLPIGLGVGLACLIATALIFGRSAPPQVSDTTNSALPTLPISARELYTLFDPERPGFGTTDYPGHGNEDIPKSHAMVLMAEIERVDNGLYPELPSFAEASGRWLLDNADLNGNRVIGWGVPVAWDAYGDGSENPKDTEYTISTAIVVDGLLTWMERDPTAPRAEILRVVEASLNPYLAAEVSSPSGLAPYSLRPSDRRL